MNTNQSTCLWMIDDFIKRGLSIRIKVSGNSMKPFLQGGEMVTLKKASVSDLHKGDLVLFKNANQALVLHRLMICNRRQGWLQTKGDSLSKLDPPISVDAVIGKVSMVEKKTQQINLLSWRQVFYKYKQVYVGLLKIWLKSVYRECRQY